MLSLILIKDCFHNARSFGIYYVHMKLLSFVDNFLCIAATLPVTSARNSMSNEGLSNHALLTIEISRAEVLIWEIL